MGNSFEEEQGTQDMTSVATLADNVVYRVPGADDTEIRKSLVSAYRDFCRVSSCYTSRRVIPLECRKCRYPVPALIPNSFVDSVSEVRLDGRRLTPTADYTVANGNPAAIVLDRVFVPEQSASPRPLGKLEVIAIDIPRHGSENAPSWFFDKYGEAVVAGALVRLFGMTGRSWSDAAQMAAEQVRWENFVTDARVRSVYAPDGASGSGALSALDSTPML